MTCRIKRLESAWASRSLVYALAYSMVIDVAPFRGMSQHEEPQLPYGSCIESQVPPRRVLETIRVSGGPVVFSPGGSVTFAPQGNSYSQIWFLLLLS